MRQPFGVYDTRQCAMVYIGLHDNERDCWQIYLGWPTEEEITYYKNEGLRVLPLTVQYEPPHRRVAEEMLGRPLKRGEIVHHIDGDKHNNDRSNLQVMTQSEHINSHREEMVAALRAAIKGRQS